MLGARAVRWAGILVVTLLFAFPSMASAEVPRTAFFYGKPVPPELFAQYDRVVVEPENLPAPPSGVRAETFAYVSVGEMADTNALQKEAPRGCFVARNADWRAEVANLTCPAWHAFVLERLIEPLWARGYRGFFLDTLDSFELVAKTPDARKTQIAGLATLLKKVIQRHPNVKFILNRGFDVIGRVRANVVGIAAESLFAEWNSKAKKYGPVSESDRQWLTARLQKVTNEHKLPITVIDYVPREKLEERREVARKILALGYDAWVTNAALDDLGVGQTEMVRRRVLVVHGGEQYLGINDAHVVAAAILERLGYAVDYVSRKGPLPTGHLAARYAGVVTFLTSEDPQHSAAYRAWLLDRIHERLPVVMLEGFGFPPDAEFLRELGLEPADGERSVRVVNAAPWIGYETKRIDIGKRIPDVRTVGVQNTSFLRIEDAKGKDGDAVVIGPWGGIVIPPYFMSGGDSSTRRFVVDPWTFFEKALGGEPAPILDVTTEGGQRILTVHIDGDGFASRSEIPGTPYAGQVVHDQILTRFRIPTTVSIIEGELSREGMTPAESPVLEAAARATFRLPFVEIASHSLSHPFFWADTEAGKLHNGKVPYLPIPNYRFDLHREIVGSIDYVNRRLAPDGKRVMAFLWTGDCSPSGEAVAMATAAGVDNLNGGGATQTLGSPSLTQLQPMMLPFDNGALQIYAPIQNDNVFTNHWTVYHGFRRVIETLKLTESPRRVTPLSIYYHYFSATKAAGIKALLDVYEWAEAQEPHPLYATQYIHRVKAFASASVSRHPDGIWEFSGLGPIRTLRIDPALGYPDLARSKGVAGMRDTPVGRYATLMSDHVEIAFAKAPPSGPYVERSNAEVLSFRSDGHGGTSLRLRGNVPVVFAVGGVTSTCSLRIGKRNVSGVTSGSTSVFTLSETDTGEASLVCR